MQDSIEASVNGKIQEQNIGKLAPKEPYDTMVDEFNRIASAYMQSDRITRTGAVIFGQMWLHAMRKAGFSKEDALKISGFFEGIHVDVMKEGL